MSKNLYLFQPPFVVSDVSTSRSDYILDFLTDNDRTDESEIRDVLLKFAIDEKILVRTETTIHPSTETNMASWIWHLNWANFRGMVNPVHLDDVITSFQYKDQSSTIIDRLLSLHVRLGILFDHKLLNTLCNRTIASIAIVPFDTSGLKDLDPLTWDHIHKTYPFLWICILLQSVMHTASTPLSV